VPPFLHMAAVWPILVESSFEGASSRLSRCCIKPVLRSEQHETCHGLRRQVVRGITSI